MMPVRYTAEQERPSEWLDTLRDEGGYARLVEESGVAIAAHRLARAICRTRSLPTTLPTQRELVAAARILGAACSIDVPGARFLSETCGLAGLDVIEPMERTPAPAVAYWHHTVSLSPAQ